jgi:UDP-N-acetylmuramoylalanine--D-glutamate ligase
MHTEFENKTVAVVGLARSGLACCEVLTKLGAQVIPYDGKPASALTDAIAQLTTLGLTPMTDGAALDYSQLDYVVTSPGVRKDAAVLLGAVAAGVPVLGEIEAAYRIARAPILAITGTNGKTTTTMLLGEMLRAAGIETYIAGNIAAGDIAMPLIHAAFDAPPEAAIVAEISSFQLEWISTFRPKVAALLNISPDHGDRQTWEEYVAAKWRIFENQTEEDEAVIPHRIVYIPEFEQYVRNLPSFLWEVAAMPPDKFIVASDVDNILYDYSPVTFSSEDDGDLLCEVSEIKLPGRHNQENIMVAAGMAMALEVCMNQKYSEIFDTGVEPGAFHIGLEHIRKVATTFTGVVHRLEYVETIDGVKYVNNSMCTNADAFEKSLQALPEPKVVIAGGVFKGGDVQALGDAVARNNVKALVLIGRSAPEIDNAARAAGYQNVHRAGTLTEAVTLAASLAQAGDTVLLAPACASFDMFADFEDRGDQFKAAVREHTPGLERPG